MWTLNVSKTHQTFVICFCRHKWFHQTQKNNNFIQSNNVFNLVACCCNFWENNRWHVREWRRESANMNCHLFHSVVHSVQTMSSSVGCITVTSAHCSITSVPSCSYWLLFSPADFPSVSWVSVDCRVKWQIAPSDIPLCTTTQAAQQRLKVPPGANLLLKTMNSFFKAFFCFCVCQLFSSLVHISVSVWRWSLVFLL